MPHGMIHHWIGAMFVPNVTLDQVMSVLAVTTATASCINLLSRKPWFLSEARTRLS